MAPPDSPDMGVRLDEHHPPETNGRMSVCRRCGFRTDGPEGRHHYPSGRQLDPSEGWLAAQGHLTSIEDARSRARSLGPPSR
jgi:hypothetical protein